MLAGPISRFDTEWAGLMLHCVGCGWRAAWHYVQTITGVWRIHLYRLQLRAPPPFRYPISPTTLLFHQTPHNLLGYPYLCFAMVKLYVTNPPSISYTPLPSYTLPPFRPFRSHFVPSILPHTLGDLNILYELFEVITSSLIGVSTHYLYWLILNWYKTDQRIIV